MKIDFIAEYYITNVDAKCDRAGNANLWVPCQPQNLKMTE